MGGIGLVQRSGGGEGAWLYGGGVMAMYWEGARLMLVPSLTWLLSKPLYQDVFAKSVARLKVTMRLRMFTTTSALSFVLFFTIALTRLLLYDVARPRQMRGLCWYNVLTSTYC